MTHAGLATALLAENSLFKAIGTIFHPIFELFATVLAFIYGVIPNYAIAIALLTILIMAILTPLTVKSTKSMIAMQRMQPEIKKLQAKYKGAENREQLNAELMRLYKEEGINPAGGCIPMLLQMPFLIVLYDVIRGITNTVASGQKYVTSTNVHLTCHPLPGATVCANPRYIPTSSTMYHHLIASSGAMYSFGMNLALKPFSKHSSWEAAIPFFVLVAIAVILQFVQMRQMSARNPQAAQANPQMQTMQKIMPIFFAYIYFLIPAAVVIYMVVSTLIRIATQDVMFRMGIVQPVGAERTIPANSTVVEKKTGGRGLLAAASAALGRGGDDPAGGDRPAKGAPPAPPDKPPRASGQTGKAKPSAAGGPGGPGQAGANGNGKSANGKAAGASKQGGTAKQAGGPRQDGAGGGQPKPHPRSKTKRERKAR